MQLNKIEIKQTKMNIYCLHFYPVFSTAPEQFYYISCTATKVCLEDIKHHIWVTSHFAYVELRITRSISSIPLDFKIARLTCNFTVI